MDQKFRVDKYISFCSSESYSENIILLVPFLPLFKFDLKFFQMFSTTSSVILLLQISILLIKSSISLTFSLKIALNVCSKYY